MYKEPNVDPMSEQPLSDEHILPLEGKVELEALGRIRATKAALDKLVDSANQYAHQFRRTVEIYKVDSAPDLSSGVYERWVPTDVGGDNLSTIDLWTFPDEDSEDAYRMSLTFSHTEEKLPDHSKPLMVTIESPLDLRPFQYFTAEVAAGGVPVRGRRIQDFLYADGAEVVPVREADFSVLHSYRSTGREVVYKATRAQMDVILDILSEANIMKEGQKLDKAAALVPEFEDIQKV